MISVEIILVGDESRKYISVDLEIIVMFGNERMRMEGVNYIFKQVKVMNYCCGCWSGSFQVIWRRLLLFYRLFLGKRDLYTIMDYRDNDSRQGEIEGQKRGRGWVFGSGEVVGVKVIDGREKMVLCLSQKGKEKVGGGKDIGGGVGIY